MSAQVVERVERDDVVQVVHPSSSVAGIAALRAGARAAGLAVR